MMSNRKASELNKYLHTLSYLGFNSEDDKVKLIMSEIEKELGLFEKERVTESTIPSVIVKDTNKAHVITIIDSSGSMGAWEEHVSKEYYELALEGIKNKYNDVSETFISHSNFAKYCTKEEIFTGNMEGGTIVSSALELALEKIDVTREVIIIQFSDGDNLMADNNRTIRILEEILPKVKYYKYFEVNQYNRLSNLSNIYKNIKDKNFSYYIAKQRDDALKGIRFIDEINKLEC